ncbi:MAG: hypothetical protein ACTHOH_17230 [Lysobacteraceae bacterium]
MPSPIAARFPAGFPLLSTALLLMLAACRATPAPAPAGEAPAASPAAPSPAAATTAAAVSAPAPAPSAKPLPGAVAEGRPYAGVRAALLADGWLPLRDPECRSNIGGDADVCDELPEVESCSSDGYCNMAFADGARRLAITTYGPYDRWNAPGQDSALQVKSFEVKPLPADVPPACPSTNFDAFLKVFASDDAVRTAFTAPLVKVAELHSDAEGDHERMVYVARDKYAGFNVGFSDGAFHFVDSTGQSDPKPLQLKITRESDDARFVSYDYNVSEGNSYRFRLADNCWLLTQDPEMPSP